MENQEFNQELLDYLYGELNSVQSSEFEKRLKEDKLLRKEYNDLVSVRQELATLGDKEVMEPFSTWEKSRNRKWFQKSENSRWVDFRPIAAIAASITILLLVGFSTDFSISISRQGFYLGFGQADDSSASADEYISRADVQALIKQEVNNSNESFSAQLINTEDSYIKKLASLESTINKLKKENSQSTVDENDIKAFFELAELNNAKMMKEYLKTTSQQQQTYFKEMFTQFNNFYREQRESDLAMIQSSLFDINQQQAIQKQQTDKALVSLYTAVNKTEH